jgi:hypothetical protein
MTSRDFDDFVHSWFDPGEPGDPSDSAAVDVRVREAEKALIEAQARQYGTDDDVIAAELAAIRDRTERQSELAHANILFTKGDVTGARQMWEDIAAGGHPSHSARAQANLTHALSAVDVPDAPPPGSPAPPATSLRIEILDVEGITAMTLNVGSAPLGEPSSDITSVDNAAKPPGGPVTVPAPEPLKVVTSRGWLPGPLASIFFTAGQVAASATLFSEGRPVLATLVLGLAAVIALAVTVADRVLSHVERREALRRTAVWSGLREPHSTAEGRRPGSDQDHLQDGGRQGRR